MGFDIVGFIGLGLIGGSIAKKLKSNHPDVKIYATAGHESTVIEAYREGIICNSKLLTMEEFAECDYIFLCAPVQKNLTYLEKLKSVIKPTCMITDVGSTKSEIHKRVVELDMEDNFIGGHPMTGSEKTGILNANEYLLENAYYIITPTSTTPAEKIDEFRNFVLELGSIPMVLDYEAHDYATAAISHLPHMIAYSLVNLVKKIDTEDETMKAIAAGGFKDITRIASSSPVMWQNICCSNRKQLLCLMDLYMDELELIRDMIRSNDEQEMLDYFHSAKDYRDSIAITKAKSTGSVYELYMDLPDEAGSLAPTVAILAENSISIKNIGIINNREFEDGVLRIEFNDENARTLAEQLLITQGYRVYKR